MCDNILLHIFYSVLLLLLKFHTFQYLFLWSLTDVRRRKKHLLTHFLKTYFLLSCRHLDFKSMLLYLHFQPKFPSTGYLILKIHKLQTFLIFMLSIEQEPSLFSCQNAAYAV